MAGHGKAWREEVSEEPDYIWSEREFLSGQNLDLRVEASKSMSQGPSWCGSEPRVERKGVQAPLHSRWELGGPGESQFELGLLVAGSFVTL